MNSFVALFDVLGELARRRHQAAERAFSAVGLNHTEARLLTLLGQGDGAAPQDALSNRLSVDRSNAVRALQRLEQDGYIVRRRDEADKRANQIRITPKGRKSAGEIGKLRRMVARTFFGRLTEDDAALVVELLNKAIASQTDEASARASGAPASRNDL